MEKPKKPRRKKASPKPISAITYKEKGNLYYKQDENGNIVHRPRAAYLASLERWVNSEKAKDEAYKIALDAYDKALAIYQEQEAKIAALRSYKPGSKEALEAVKHHGGKRKGAPAHKQVGPRLAS